MVPADYKLTADASARLERLFGAKARAELKAADALLGRPIAVAGSGDVLGSVVILKGTPAEQDRASRRALAGPDGDAAAKAIEALGLDPAAVFAQCTRPVVADAQARARRVELIVEAVDPRLVIALDAEAAEDLAAAFGVRSLPAGQPASVRGRTLGCVGDLAASLVDTGTKARVWAHFKTIAKAAGVGPRASK